MSTTRAIAIAACCFIGLLPTTAAAQAYDDLIRAYRRGDVDRAVEGLAALGESDAVKRERDRWMNDLLRAEEHDTDTGAVAKLNAALLLHTEVAFGRLIDESADRLPAGAEAQVAIVARFHNSLRTRPAHRPFLRLWYLLWESLRQSNPLVRFTANSEYLTRALDTFPDDGELLLAMGSRHELSWWLWTDNAHRDPDGRSRSAVQFLRSARDYLQRSVRAPRPPSESLLRLVRVHLLLGELDASAAELRKFQALDEGPAFKYLGLLFEGALLEERGDLAAAARVYDRAVGLVGVPQSAQIARAHVAHALGDRRDAADRVVRAMRDPLAQADPWWWYIRGQAWRVDFYLANARKMVRE